MDLVIFFASIQALLGFGYVCYRIDQDNKKCFKIREQFKKQFQND